MGKAGWLAGAFILSMLLVYSGCGSDSGSTETSAKPKRLYPRVHGPAREFLIPGGDNAVQFFGQEATAAERVEVSHVVHPWMRARVAEDWAKDCKYLSRVYARTLINDARGVSGQGEANCAQALDFFGDEASGTSGETLTGPIDSLRVRGVKAFAQWHGPHGIDWVLPLRNEEGVWKVELAAPVERTK
jgi:hypothetical protein